MWQLVFGKHLNIWFVARMVELVTRKKRILRDARYSHHVSLDSLGIRTGWRLELFWKGSSESWVQAASLVRVNWDNIDFLFFIPHKSQRDWFLAVPISSWASLLCSPILYKWLLFPAKFRRLILLWSLSRFLISPVWFVFSLFSSTLYQTLIFPHSKIYFIVPPPLATELLVSAHRQNTGTAPIFSSLDGSY